MTGFFVKVKQTNACCALKRLMKSSYKGSMAKGSHPTKIMVTFWTFFKSCCDLEKKYYFWSRHIITTSEGRELMLVKPENDQKISMISVKR